MKSHLKKAFVREWKRVGGDSSKLPATMVFVRTLHVAQVQSHVQRDMRSRHGRKRDRAWVAHRRNLRLVAEEFARQLARSQKGKSEGIGRGDLLKVREDLAQVVVHQTELASGVSLSLRGAEARRLCDIYPFCV